MLNNKNFVSFLNKQCAAMLAAPLFGVYSFDAYFHISTWMGCKSAKIMVLQTHKNLKRRSAANS